LAELQTRFERVMRDVRRLPGGDWLYQRVDAYPGVRLDRDMGAGQDADTRFAKVAAFLEGDPAAESATSPPHRGPWASPGPVLRPVP
jgi:hypothetical protein